MGKQQLGRLIGVNQRKTYYELHFEHQLTARLYILDQGIFRFVLDPSGQYAADAQNSASDAFIASKPRATSDSFIVRSGSCQLIFNLHPATLTIFDEDLHRNRFKQISPFEIGNDNNSEFLQANKNEYYFGAGNQNGRFNHRGERLHVKADNISGFGGNISPSTFFWSNAGYGEYRKGEPKAVYDFGASHEGAAILSAKTGIIDIFYLIGNSPAEIINKYYQVSKKPLLPPKYLLGFGYQENFANTYWEPAEPQNRHANRFEDNNYYVRTNDPSAANGKSSLNGEEKYQFSARALIDRFQKQGFSLSYLLPNSSGQKVDEHAAATLFEYANMHGIACGLAGQLADGSDFIRQDNPAGLTENFAQLKKQLNRKRPLVFLKQELAGKQDRAALAYSDAENSWDSIKCQIASILGACLSGQNLVGSAIAGSRGGGNARLFVRDLEWKTFTPLFFADGSYRNKTPFAYNKKTSKINSAYLHLRAHLSRYLYSLFYQSMAGSAVVRPLFWEFGHDQLSYTNNVKHEFMLGPNLLVAPITSGQEDETGNSIKNNIYLPDMQTMWIDLFTGEKFAGGRNYNQMHYPLWHLPVFVRGGAILETGRRNFTFYPQRQSSSSSYADNGFQDYQHNNSQTAVHSCLTGSTLNIKIDPSRGSFAGQDKKQATYLNIMCDHYPDQICLKINGKKVELQEYGAQDSFAHAKEGFFFNPDYRMLPEFQKYVAAKQAALQIKLAPRDIFAGAIELTITGVDYGKKVLVHAIIDSLLHAPGRPRIDKDSITSRSFKVLWPGAARQVQLEVNGIIFTNITGNSFTLHELTPDCKYVLRLRYLAGQKVSEWTDPFGAITKKDPLTNSIKNITVSCNYGAEKGYPLAYLCDGLTASEWHSTQIKDKALTLTFTFSQVETLRRMVYVPRSIDHTGLITQVKIESSLDGENFSNYQDEIKWKDDYKNKVVGMRGLKAKAIRLTVLASQAQVATGKEFFFFKGK